VLSFTFFFENKLGFLASQRHMHYCAGITEPVRGGVDRWDRAGGVGRQEQDEDMTNEQNIERRKLAVEVEETDVDREKREVRPCGPHSVDSPAAGHTRCSLTCSH
jgi:hypothetical protein